MSIINSGHAGHTFTYNGLQFGGNDGPVVDGRKIRCDLPDDVRLVVTPIPDESGRAVKWHECRLSFQTCFYADSEAELRANMDVVRRRLEAPRRPLRIDGLGLGIGDIIDLDFGPKPAPLELFPLGELACQVSWSVTFCIAPCALSNLTGSEWTEFVWATSWSNNLEGITIRTVSGHVAIVGGPGRPTAEVVRNVLVIACPDGFRRLNNAWRESEDKRRIDFAVVDEQLPGDAYPKGIIAASGDSDFNSGTDTPGALTNGTIGISMNLTIAPGRPRGYAATYFFKAMLWKQQQLVEKLGKGKGTVLLSNLRIRQGAWDSSRQFQCSASWVVYGCISDMLAASGVWEPFRTADEAKPDYKSWRESIQHLWVNRGTSEIGVNQSESVVINICDGVSSGIIGQTSAKVLAPDAQYPTPTFKCDPASIPVDGGWLQYDVQVRVLRKDSVSWHKRAISYVIGQSALITDPLRLGGPSFQMSPDQKHVAETHGLPETFVILKFKGLRYGRKPVVPSLLKVGSTPEPPTFIEESDEKPRIAYRLFGCPVWFHRAWRLYRVNGYVASFAESPNENDCFGAINTSGQH